MLDWPNHQYVYLLVPVRLRSTDENTNVDQPRRALKLPSRVFRRVLLVHKEATSRPGKSREVSHWVSYMHIDSASHGF